MSDNLHAPLIKSILKESLNPGKTEKTVRVSIDLSLHRTREQV